MKKTGPCTPGAAASATRGEPVCKPSRKRPQRRALDGTLPLAFTPVSSDNLKTISPQPQFSYRKTVIPDINMCYVPLCFGNQVVNALVDSGSTCCIVDADIFQIIIQSDAVRQCIPSSLCAASASGNVVAFEARSSGPLEKWPLVLEF